MMATIQVRISDKDKKEVQKILESLGLDLTTAVRIFFKRVVISDGLPFPVRHDLTVNGFTPEFEEEVLKAAQDEEGSIEFENSDDAIAFLHSRIKKS